VIEEREDLEITVKSSLSAKEMRQELELSDLAVVPASGILLEVISQGVPVISGFYVDNQKGIYEGFNNLGVFIDAKDFDKEVFTETIHSVNTELLSVIKQNQSQAIDGFSGVRIQKILKNLSRVCV
jgi:UDP-2,4-diacetamido-2,4,6-trideoxy-beta-L-altropyranose hydrolase